MRYYTCTICELDYPAEELDFSINTYDNMSEELIVCSQCEDEILDILMPIQILWFY